MHEAHSHKLEPSPRMTRYMHAHKNMEEGMCDISAHLVHPAVDGEDEGLEDGVAEDVNATKAPAPGPGRQCLGRLLQESGTEGTGSCRRRASWAHGQAS